MLSQRSSRRGTNPVAREAARGQHGAEALPAEAWIPRSLQVVQTSHPAQMQPGDPAY